MAERERLNAILSHLIINNETINNLNTENCSNDKEFVKHGGSLVGLALEYLGVKNVFCLAGGHISPILVGCEDVNIKVVDVRDEASAVFAADAVSRLTGIPGVAIVTAGPGLTNTITAVKNAQLAESPLVVMAGATSMLLKGRGSLQDIDQQALMKPHVKWMKSLKNVKQIIPTVMKAFSKARSGVPGPVFLEFPLDVIYPRELTEREIVGQSSTDDLSWFTLSIKQIRLKIQDLYLKRYVNGIFQSDGLLKPTQRYFENYDKPITSDPNPKLKSSISTIVSQLEKSSNPVMILGSQCIQKDSYQNLINAIITLNIPVFLSGMARGLLGENHELHIRHKRRIALQNADFVMICGVGTDFRLGYGRGINSKAYFVMVNLNDFTLTQNKDLRKRDLMIQDHPCSFLHLLSQHIDPNFTKEKFSSWLATCRKHHDQREAEINQIMENEIQKINSNNNNQNVLEEGLNPIYVCREVNNVIDEDSIIVCDGGDFVGTASYTILPRGPLSWLDPGIFGTLGVGGGFAIGAKLSRPTAEVWLIYGDGSSAYSLAEIDTCIRHNIPIIAVIGNDSKWAQIYRDQVPVLGSDVACTLKPKTEYHTVSIGYGGKGIVISQPDQLKDALIEAKRLAASGHPVVINCILSQSKFREGSISI